jgi:hypothetical protein
MILRMGFRSTAALMRLADTPSRRSLARAAVVTLVLGLGATLALHALALFISGIDPTQTWQRGFIKTPQGEHWRMAWQGNRGYERLHIESRERWRQWNGEAGFPPDLEDAKGRELPSHRRQLPHWLKPPGAGEHLLVVRAYGWPARAFYLEYRVSAAGTTCRGMLRIPLASGAIELPVGIIWTGLAINVLFWGTLIWVYFAAERRLVRHLRRRRGCCPTCQYDIRGLRDPVCPECGGALGKA